MSPVTRYFAWMYLRAFVWIVICSLCLRKGTGNWKVVRAFFGAHLAALGFAMVTDLFLFAYAPPRLLQIEVLQWIFTIPIVIFTIISLWICNWEKPVKIPDVLITMVPLVLWGLLVIFGWQWGMSECHVLGAWFSSAAAGAVDLCARYGPPAVTRRPYTARLAGYAVVVVTVYLLLPRTQ